MNLSFGKLSLLWTIVLCWGQILASPIDVVIPAVEKDLPTLDLCIEGIRKNGVDVRRIIVISADRLTDQAEWFDEKKFPFSFQDVSDLLASLNSRSAPPERIGWYFQQLLKVYALYVIPDLSSNVLVLDSDTVFLNPVEFINSLGEPLYNVGTEWHRPYFFHMQKFFPTLGRTFEEHSGICHHMLFQKEVLDILFQKVQRYQRTPLWRAFCLCVDPNGISQSGASEYEIYFNFLFGIMDKGRIRILKWDNISSLEDLERYQMDGYHYVSCHAYLRQS